MKPSFNGKRLALMGVGVAGFVVLSLILMVNGVFPTTIIGGGAIDPNNYLTEMVDETVAVSSVPDIVIENNVGAVTVVSSANASSITIHAIKRAQTDHLLRSIQVQIKQVNNHVEVATTGNGFRVIPFGGNTHSVQYEVSVPRTSNVLIRTFTKASPISISGVDGMVDAYSESSAINVNNCNGQIAIKTGNGPVSIENSQGNVDFQSEVFLQRPS